MSDTLKKRLLALQNAAADNTNLEEETESKTIITSASALPNVFSNDGTFLERFKATQGLSDEKQRRMRILKRKLALEARIVSFTDM